ncbi:MAG: TM0106 family RecB-like putative nuclease [Propionibacteriaceae bacterium]|nr:TM0106 family RecB-like putative nuclease [Propionibacteriaceae bacterium]
MTFVLDAYAARSCPLKTVNSFNPHILTPTDEPPDPPFFRDADAIEAAVFEAVRRGGGDIVDLRPLRTASRADAEQACLAALASGADVVIGGLLPRDEDHHRTGRPSLLVRSPQGGYHPVHVKFHRVLESSAPDGPGLVASRLGSPTARVAVPGRRFRWGHRLNAALQVAHYWRLLEATGHAAAEPWAGLVGIDQISLPGEQPIRVGQVITWLDLADRCVPPNPRTLERPEDAAFVSTLERYDDEHRYRVELAEAALTASGQDALLTPILSTECRGCIWQEHCQAQVDADDLSLRITKAPLDVHEVRTLRRLGISTVAELAATDLDELLADYLPRASHRIGGEARLRRAHRRAQLLHAGIELERQTQGPLDLPAHALEIDIDLETSADDRVYLWGFCVDDPSTGEPMVRQFAAFTDLDDAAERALAAEALTWLRSVVEGHDAAVYHYSDYEMIRLNRLAPKLGEVGAWASAWASEHFEDLFEVVRTHFFGAHGLGLKVVTSAVTGFAWRDEDPGGLNSQRWFAEAVGDPDERVREQARVRVLEYNEDDVRATWHLRRWLREQR